ncbi:MAG: DNA replication/repair protein RecF, partial [Solobacterium sp.]|nr:DNA replication/repair protein RecF [Solobacterium sp.]
GDDDVEKILDVIIHPQGKTLAINGIAIQKVSDFIGKLNVILFSPDDLFIFNDQPKERRRWIDQEIAKINPTYVKHLNLLKSILKERNSLLKRERIDAMYYDILTERMIEH